MKGKKIFCKKDYQIEKDDKVYSYNKGSCWEIVNVDHKVYKCMSFDYSEQRTLRNDFSEEEIFHNWLTHSEYNILRLESIGVKEGDKILCIKSYEHYAAVNTYFSDGQIQTIFKIEQSLTLNAYINTEEVMLIPYNFIIKTNNGYNRLSGYEISNYWTNLAKYRENQIDSILND